VRNCFDPTLESRKTKSKLGVNSRESMTTLQDEHSQAESQQAAQPPDAQLQAAGRALMDDPKDAGLFETYRRLLDRRLDGADGYNDLAIAMTQLGQLDRAESCFGLAIAMQPDNPCFHNNLGRLLRDRGQTAESLPCYREALRLQPDYANAHWNLALALLASGSYQEGWQHFSWRNRADLDAILDTQRQAPTGWQGEPFVGKRLLIRYEQGLGDNIQLMRYLPLVKARGGTVVLETLPALERLFSGLAGVDELVRAAPDGKPTTRFDSYVFAFDLPRIFNTDLESIPRNGPYLTTPKPLQASWKQRLNCHETRIGIVWAGSPRHSNDRNRSCDFSYFAKLSHGSNAQWFSLQKGPAQEALHQSCDHRINDLNPYLHDFADTAAAIENLDLVISVDTAVLHLAGALGKTAWGLLPHVADWRWLLHRNDSPWYPSLRLFRQDAPGDWAGLMARVHEQLQVHVTAS